MKILVTGATGATGREIVKKAVEQGHAVTALVRDAAKANFAAPVVLAAGNVLDRGSLTRAAAGQEAVIYSLGSGISESWGGSR